MSELRLVPCSTFARILAMSKRTAIGLAFAALIAVVVIRSAPWSPVAPQDMSEGFSDAEFWKVITDFSEPGGYFRSDNFISNELTFQTVIPDLREKLPSGGVYLGVGPDQNFTYIVALQPKLAFIVDIRRQNMLLHLMYKALLELSANRAEFVSKLFARRLPPDLPNEVPADRLFEALNAAETDAAFAKAQLSALVTHLRVHHGFTLTEEDVRSLEYVYTSFVAAGPELRYSFPNRYGWRRFPSYSQLMLESDDDGVNHSYLASEDQFQILKRLESENRIVPVVGDFAGEKALRSIGRYLTDHGATVTAFYTSNVEFYLFQSDDWKRFLDNVSKLPVDEKSLFIRAYFNNYGFRFPNQPFGARSITLLDNIGGLVSAFDAGDIQSYFDVIKRSSR